MLYRGPLNFLYALEALNILVSRENFDCIAWLVGMFITAKLRSFAKRTAQLILKLRVLGTTPVYTNQRTTSRTDIS